MSTGGREIEIKLAIPSASGGRALLRRAGFRLSRRRTLEKNAVFDTPEGTLYRGGCVLRVRSAGGSATLTFKGRPVASKHKTREEIETEVRDSSAMGFVLERLGFRPVFRYEKYRTEFSRSGGEAMLDETPIGVYLELEGPPRWIDRAARDLGFTEDQYITASYASLHMARRREKGLPLSDMVFR